MKPRIEKGTLYAAVFLAVLSLVLFGANLLFTAREVRTARGAAASVIQLCQASNESRAQQITLWDHLFTVAANNPPQHETAAQQRRRLATARAFEAYIHRAFAPRNCAHL